MSYQGWAGQYPVSPGGQKKKRSAWPIVVAVVAVVAVGAGVGVWLLLGGSGDDPSAELPTNPNLKAMSFPDPDSFGYSDGPEAMCAALDEVMGARGYLHLNGKKYDGGQSCLFITPGLSKLADGSNDMRVDIGVWRGDTESRYESLQSNALEESQQNPGSKVERFPAGDTGFIYHRKSMRTDTTAHFRSGDDLMTVAVWGTALVSATSETPETEPLPEEVTYREITDIVMSLSGDGEPGPPQITAPELTQSPVLAGLANLPFPEGLTVGDACAKLASVAATLGMQQKTSTECGFKAGSDDWRDHGAGYTEWEISVFVTDYPPEGNIVAAEELARDLRSLLRISTDRPCGPLYELPFADTGYATYCGNILQAGFVLDGRTYVKVDMNGHRAVAGTADNPLGDLEPLTEDEILGHLATMLTAMSG